MNVTLVMVASADGKTTFWKSPHIHGWSSDEDHQHFLHTRERFRVLIMGRKTYEAVKTDLVLSTDLLRIVLTKNPKLYQSQAVPNKLEFTDALPAALLSDLSRRGYANVLLVGGSIINTIFLREHAITDILLTIEPKIFGIGNPLFSEHEFDLSLRLIDVKRLNGTGTIVLHYNVHYDR